MTKTRFGLVVLIIALSAQYALAQTIDVTGGLGLEYYAAPSLSNYIAGTVGGVTPGTFTTSVQLEAALELLVIPDWSVGIEYAYLTNQFSGNGWQINYSYSLPSLTLRRILVGDNYYLRLGGAIGYHSSALSQNPNGLTANYSANGIGLKFDAAIDTKLGENFYARIDADVRTEFTGFYKDKSGHALINYNDSTEVSSRLSGIGVTFGLVYYF